MVMTRNYIKILLLHTLLTCHEVHESLGRLHMESQKYGVASRQASLGGSGYPSYSGELAILFFLPVS